MLDILRNTEGLKDAKVIMLTALGQAEDKTRADSLGADRYLVKSQVTLEDIVKAADELLNGGVAPAAEAATAEPAPAAPAPTPVAMTMATPPPEAGAPAPAPTAAVPVAAPPVMTPAPSPAPVATSTPTPAAPPAAVSPAPVAAPAIPVTPPPASAPATAPVISMPTTPASVPPVAPTPPPAQPSTTVPSQTAAPSAPAADGAQPQPEKPAAVPTETEDKPATPVASEDAPAPATPEASKPEVEAPQEAAPAPEASPAAADDKLIADAMKNLTETLKDEQPGATSEAPVKADEPAKAPSIEDTATPEEPVAPQAAVEDTAPTAPVVPTPAPEAEVKAPETPAEPTVSTLPPEAEQKPDVEAPQEAAPAPEVPAAVPTETEDKPTEQPAAGEDHEVTPTAASHIEGAASAADEQAAMQAQIDDFINQQSTGDSGTGNPAPSVVTPGDASSPSVPQTQPGSDITEQDAFNQLPDLSDAPKGTVITSDSPLLGATPNDHPAAVNPVVPPTAPAQQAPENTAADESGDDPVSIAHKKIIQPPVEPIQTQPDLSELLAKEGISSLDDHEEAAPGAQQPHQPGHVISPNGTPAAGQSGFNPSDPNNIAL